MAVLRIKIVNHKGKVRDIRANVTIRVKEGIVSSVVVSHPLDIISDKMTYIALRF